MTPIISVCYGSYCNRFGGHNLLHETKEYKPSTLGISSVKSKRELFQIRLEMFWHNRSLMRAQYPALKETGNTMYTWHCYVCWISRCGKYSPFVFISKTRQSIVTSPTISVHSRSIDRNVPRKPRFVSGVKRYVSKNQSYLPGCPAL